MESLTPERSRTIEIIDFIDMKEMDSIYYDRPYYLVPLKGGEKSYSLLAEAMGRTNRVGLAKFVLGEREYLVAVKSTQGALAVIVLHYREDILPYDDIEPEEGDGESEVKGRMKSIVKEMTTGFNPDRYADRRRLEIMNLLRKKAKQIPLAEAPKAEKEEAGGPADLVAALEESMRKIKERQ